MDERVLNLVILGGLLLGLILSLVYFVTTLAASRRQRRFEGALEPYPADQLPPAALTNADWHPEPGQAAPAASTLHGIEPGTVHPETGEEALRQARAAAQPRALPDIADLRFAPGSPIEQPHVAPRPEHAPAEERPAAAAPAVPTPSGRPGPPAPVPAPMPAPPAVAAAAPPPPFEPETVFVPVVAEPMPAPPEPAPPAPAPASEARPPAPAAPAAVPPSAPKPMAPPAPSAAAPAPAIEKPPAVPPSPAPAAPAAEPAPAASKPEPPEAALPATVPVEPEELDIVLPPLPPDNIELPAWLRTPSGAPAAPAPVPEPNPPAPAAPAPAPQAAAPPVPAAVPKPPAAAPAAPAEPQPTVTARPAPEEAPPLVVHEKPAPPSEAPRRPETPGIPEYHPVAPIELRFADGSAPVGVKPGTRTFEEFQRAAAVLFADLHRSQAES